MLTNNFIKELLSNSRCSGRTQRNERCHPAKPSTTVSNIEHPSDKGKSVIKSIWITYQGLSGTGIGWCIPAVFLWSPFYRWQTSHCLQWVATVLPIFDHQNFSLNICNVLTCPKCPRWSWYSRNTMSIMLVGTTILPLNVNTSYPETDCTLQS